MPISWSLDDYPVFEHMRLPNSIQTGLMNASLVYDNWLADFTYLADNYDWGVPTPFTRMSRPGSSASDVGAVNAAEKPN
jgi:hypothetical protein